MELSFQKVEKLHQQIFLKKDSGILAGMLLLLAIFMAASNKLFTMYFYSSI